MWFRNKHLVEIIIYISLYHKQWHQTNCTRLSLELVAIIYIIYKHTSLTMVLWYCFSAAFKSVLLSASKWNIINSTKLSKKKKKQFKMVSVYLRDYTQHFQQVFVTIRSSDVSYELRRLYKAVTEHLRLTLFLHSIYASHWLIVIISQYRKHIFYIIIRTLAVRNFTSVYQRRFNNKYLWFFNLLVEYKILFVLYCNSYHYISNIFNMNKLKNMGAEILWNERVDPILKSITRNIEGRKTCFSSKHKKCR